MFGGLVVYGQLDLVGLVDFDVVVLGLPAIGSRCLRTRHDGVLDLHGNKRLWASSESPGRSVINILDRYDSNRQLSAEGLSETRGIDGVIFNVS